MTSTCTTSALSPSTSVFFFSSRRRHTRFDCDWSSDVCSSDLMLVTGSHDRTARVYDTAATSLEHFWTVDDMSILTWASAVDGSRVAVVDRSGGKIGRASCRERV